MKKYIGESIRKRRQELNINQQTLADLSGVGINTLVAVERGAGNPSVDTLEKLFSTLGMTIRIEF